jgi:bifunctional NMN adenylyltransferase/nudix hydrolase
MKYDLLMYGGKFQPFHLGHKSVLDHALTISEYVVVMIGSADAPRCPRNFLTAEDRISMISACYPVDVAFGRIIFIAQPDHLYDDDRWRDEVTFNLNQISSNLGLLDDATVGIIGHDKDPTSFYLHIFPQLEFVEVPAFFEGLSATPIRAEYLLTGQVQTRNLPSPVSNWLGNFRNSAAFSHLRREQQSAVAYRDLWKDAPFPVTVNTVDAVVVHHDHVLLIRRKNAPGMGLLALPGGYIEPHERLYDACMRELDEETLIAVPRAVLDASFQDTATFDHPQRSNLCRCITQAFFFDIPEELPQPAVVGGDDAAEAMWVRFSDIKRSEMFADHYHIIASVENSGL